MPTTWILVTDAHRARCFEQTTRNGPLHELADLVQPHAHGTTPDRADRSGDAGKGHGRTGHAGTQFEPTTETAAKQRNRFARQLAEYLNQGVADQRCTRLALIATSPMLGVLKPLLSPAAHKLLRHSVAADFTHLQGPDLQRRVQEALGLPD